MTDGRNVGIELGVCDRIGLGKTDGMELGKEDGIVEGIKVGTADGIMEEKELGEKSHIVFGTTGRKAHRLLHLQRHHIRLATVCERVRHVAECVPTPHGPGFMYKSIVSIVIK